MSKKGVYKNTALKDLPRAKGLLDTQGKKEFWQKKFIGKKWLSTEELCVVVGLSRFTVDRLRKDGIIKSHSVAGQRGITFDAVECSDDFYKMDLVLTELEKNKHKNKHKEQYEVKL